jgi:hypothetical protein
MDFKRIQGMKMKNIQKLCLALVLLSSNNAYSNEWIYKKSVDDFNDETIYTASISLKSVNQNIVVRCDENKEFDLFFTVGEFIGSHSNFDVKYRIDKNETMTDKWDISTQGTSVFVGEREKYKLAREMINGEKIVIAVADFRGTTNKAKFSLKGAKSKIEPVMLACNVPLDNDVVINIPEDKVIPEVLTEIANWGAKTTRCSKKMLKELGYSITDDSGFRTPDLYIAFQNFVDTKATTCKQKKESGDLMYKYTQCKTANEYVRTASLFSDATQKNMKYSSMCGHLRSGD